MPESKGISEFILINEKRFPLKMVSFETDMLPYYRWEHRVTIGYRGRRFMVCVDNLKCTSYIEEITTGSVSKIDAKEQKLWEALTIWATEQQYLNVLPPMMKHKRFV